MQLFFTSVVLLFFICDYSSIAAMKRGPTRTPAAQRSSKQFSRTKWYTCDFESGYCGWKNDSTAEFQWYRTAAETPTDETGPRWDHTKAVQGQGHYLYIETSVPRENGDHARIISPALLEQGVFCLNFWHNMHGSDIKDLNVYIKGRRSKKLTTIKHLSGPWSLGSNVRNLAGEDNDWWNQESVEFVVREPVNIIFEGVRGKGYYGDIAIDDIELKKGRCLRKSSLSCDFENSMCGWSQMSGDEFNWLPHRGHTQTRNTGPPHDHTLQNPSGRYMYIESSWPRVEGDKARIISPRISCDKGAKPVFNFWYNMNGDYMGPLKVYATRDSRLLGKAIWTKDKNQKEQWYLGQVVISNALSTKGSFYIVIEAERKDYLADVAIDDVSLTGCQKTENAFGRKTSLTTPPTAISGHSVKAATARTRVWEIPKDKVLPDGIDCDFEQNSFCEWRQDSDDHQFDWLLNQKETPSDLTGPNSDHTTRVGWYLYAEASKPRKSGDKAVIRSPAIKPSITSCVSFYYHMYGKEMGKLELLSVARDGYRFKRRWYKRGEQSRDEYDWRFAKVTVQESVPYQIVFRAYIGDGFHSDIAIDDVVVTPRACDNEETSLSDTSANTPSASPPETTIASTAESSGNGVDCDFGQSTLCGWSQVTSPDDEFDWMVSTGPNTRSSETGPVYDHTAGSSDGYAYIEASTPRKEGDRAMLFSHVLKIKKPMCFHFWYHMYGEGTGHLSIYRKVVETGKLIPLWKNGGNKGKQWLEGMVDLRKLGDTVLVIEAKRGENWSGDISLDDFNIVEGECPTFDCDFENDNCAWVQDNQHDNFNWTRNSGSTESKKTGPDFDHTTKSESGTYLYIEASGPRQRSDKARLISPIVDPGLDSAKCLTFWFHSYGKYIGSVNVYKKSISSNDSYYGSPLWVNSRNEGHQWIFAQISVHDELPYQIVIEGVRGLAYLGDIAIDDIVLKDGACDSCCGRNQFKCGNNFCIKESLRCNDHDDCGDQSDESFCVNEAIGKMTCGTPLTYPPIREPEELPTNIVRDEGMKEVYSPPPEEFQSAHLKPKPIEGQEISDDMLKLLKHPRLSFDQIAEDVVHFSDDIQLDPHSAMRPETIKERRRRYAGSPEVLRNFGAARESGEQDEENFRPVDLIKLQTAERIVALGIDGYVSKAEEEQARLHAQKRKEVQKIVGKHHRLSTEEWKLVEPGRQHGRQEKERKRFQRSLREKRTVKKIIGGIKTSQYNYPWQVAYYITDSATKTHYFCGATLIDRYWILTAAHCPYLGDMHIVVLGEYDLFKDEGTEQEIIVEAIFSHESYKFDEDLVGDIAMIQLRYPAKQSKAVQLACLLGKEEKPFETGDICVTTGWGRTDADARGIERHLRQAEMPIISNAKCKATFWSIYAIHDSYVCAGGTGGNSCRGDSGGPLLCKRDNQFYLVGLTSWGDVRCKPNIPGVYTRVQSYHKWMHRIMSSQQCAQS